MGSTRDTTRHEFTNGKQPEAFRKAQHMARYSQKSWIVWASRDDETMYAQLMTPESLKAALLANGTKGKFYQYMPGRHNRFSQQVNWRIGLNMMRMMRLGYL